MFTCLSLAPYIVHHWLLITNLYNKLNDSTYVLWLKRLEGLPPGKMAVFVVLALLLSGITEVGCAGPESIDEAIGATKALPDFKAFFDQVPGLLSIWQGCP